jgi:membrane protease YdiL (CAAX protease family)
MSGVSNFDTLGSHEAMRGKPANSPMDIVRKASQWYSGLMIVSIGWLYFQKQLRWSLFLQNDRIEILLDLCIGMGLALLLVLFSLFANHSFSWARQLELEFQKVLTPLPFPNILLLGLTSGVAEETFFRGSLQNSVGLILSSLLFGAAHLVPKRELLPWSLYAVLVGFIFACLVEIRHCLLPVILAHSVMNIIMIGLLNRRTRIVP